MGNLIKLQSLATRKSKDSSIKNPVLTPSTKLVIGAVLSLVIAVFAFTYINQNAEGTSTPPIKDVGQYPMVGQEKNETNRIKQAPIQSPGQIVQPNSGKKNVTPMIVDASQHGDHVEVRVFVPNVTESTGSCTLTFNNGGASFTKTASSSPDAASTHCAGVTIPLNEFMPKGTWSVAVEYRSPGAEGRSNAKTFTVQ